ncbi:serine/threonine/tyrosine protein kinase RAD53, partial [Ascoidea rubescens DSM 1968]
KSSPERKWVFGRNESCDHVFGPISRLSNKHFSIWLNDSNNFLFLQDRSTNGTYLNGTRIVKGQNYILNHGDEISVGIGQDADIIKFIILISPDHWPTKKKLRDVNQKNDGIYKHFTIMDDIVGEGAFATVKKAIEKKTGTIYAVKIISKRKIEGTNVAVARELKVLSELHHPGIVRLKAFYEDENFYYLVMEYVSGGDLMDFVVAHGAIGEEAARQITKQILEAIKYVHDLGISHRDLKPDNILIAQDNPTIVKITDFGLAKISDGTFLKTFCGTLAYVAPEIIKDRVNMKQRQSRSQRTAYSCLVDMWSLGCLLYVILTGHLPFSGGTQENLFLQIKRGSYHDTPIKEAGISNTARDFLNSLLEVDPNYRLTAAKALDHPWIKVAIDSPSQISLSQSQSNQKRHDESFLQNDMQFKKSKKEKNHSISEGEISIQSNLILKADKKIPVGTYLTLKLIQDNEYYNKITNIDKTIYIKQSGSKPFIIGRNSVCNLNINEIRISKVHCIIIRKRHVVGDSIYESPAQGLDDIWLIDFSTNGCIINNKIIGRRKKTKIYHNDVLHLFYDKDSKEKLSYKLIINDGTGLFLNGN